MIFKKTISGLFFICLLNGCANSVSLLGPVYTFASTGNVYHTGLTYGSTKVVKKVTGKSPTENVKNLLENKNAKIDEVESYEEFFALVKNNIEKTSKVLNLTNQ